MLEPKDHSFVKKGKSSLIIKTSVKGGKSNESVFLKSILKHSNNPLQVI